MNEKDNEVIVKEEEKLEKRGTSKKKSVIIPILAAIIAFAVVYGGITLYEHLSSKENIVDKNDVKEENEDSNVSEDSEEVAGSNDNVNNENITDGAEGSTGVEEVISITDAMKVELNKIAGIGYDVCVTENIFRNMNGFIKDLAIENKKYLIINYYLLTNSGSDRIDEASFKKIASKYGVTEGFDTVMSGLEKVDGKYVIPPLGCVGPEKSTHNATYQDTGNTITVVDNISIINNETMQTRNVKVIYTFIYSKDSNNNISFKLEQVNSEK